MPKLNNVRYKVENGIFLDAFDILDIIWLVKFKNTMDNEDLLVELCEMYNNVNAEKYLLDVLRKCLIIWVGNLVKNLENLKLIKRSFVCLLLR